MNKKCKYCGSNDWEYYDSGIDMINYRKIKWEAWECIECGNIDSDEPDWDLIRLR